MLQQQPQLPEETHSSLYDNMRKLISTIDELKDVGVQKFIQLPRIAVIGSQSAGKSSLLEAIVGIDFLPRGEGLVTRRPLELRLVHVAPNGPEKFRPYAEFAQDKTRYYDFDKVRERIVSLTDQVAGKSKKIIDDPITMSIYSTTCPDLTLVDLPGITRIAQSDQPFDIEKVTKDMCRRYARDQRTIILAVMPANQDMALSDSLKMAREEDPHGLRTIGVLTKIDIMDQGSNAREMLLGKDIPLRLGYVGIKGRSQQDINANMKVGEALKREKEFFASHPVYEKIPHEYLGTEALTQKLTKVLFSHIKNTLPEITREIQEKIRECEERMKDLGDPLPSSQKEKLQLVWNMVTNFTENFKNNLQGRYDPRRHTKITGEMSAAGKIKLMFHNLYSEFLGKKATDGISDQEIYHAIQLHQESIPGFYSIDSFLYLIIPILNKLRDPALELVNNIHLFLESLAGQLVEKNFVRFPAMMDGMTETINKALREEKDVAQGLVENIIESEKTYIFTNDTEYMTQRSLIVPAADAKQKDSRPVSPEKLFVDEMRARIDTYFSIVIKNIRDTIPKVLGTFLVRAVQDKMQFILYNEINKNEAIMEMINEPPHIKTEREALTNVITVLNKAKLVLTRDPAITTNLINVDPPQPIRKIPQQSVNPRERENTNQAPTHNVRPQNNPFGSRTEEVPLRSAPVENRDTSLFGGNNMMRPGAIQPNTNPQYVSRPPENTGLYPQADPVQGARPSSNIESRPSGNDPLVREQKQGLGIGRPSPFGDPKRQPPS